MFNLDSKLTYWLYNKPVNMRMGFNGLSGIVCNKMGMDIRRGDVFVFINSSGNRMKILHQEECGLVLYALKMDIGRIKPLFKSEQASCSVVSHDTIIQMIRAALDTPYVRQIKFAAAYFHSQNSVKNNSEKYAIN